MLRKIPFSDATRGMFVARRPVPISGFKWVETLNVLDSNSTGPYERTGPWLVPVDGGEGDERFELPLRESDAHRRFARLRTQRRMVQFANRYGLLGVRQVLTLSPTVGQSGTQFALNGGVAEHSESWQHEIRNMAILVSLWDLVQIEDANVLSRFVFWGDTRRQVRIAFGYTLQGRLELISLRECRIGEGGLVDRRGRPIGHVSYVLAHEELSSSQLLDQWRTGEVIGPMRYHVIHAINEQIRGNVDPRILFSGRLYFQPDSLLTALYCLFALEVSGQQQPTILCARPGCGRYFMPSRKGQKYCDESCRKLAGYYRSKGRWSVAIVANNVADDMNTD